MNKSSVGKNGPGADSHRNAGEVRDLLANKKNNRIASFVSLN